MIQISGEAGVPELYKAEARGMYMRNSSAQLARHFIHAVAFELSPRAAMCGKIGVGIKKLKQLPRISCKPSPQILFK